VSRIALLMAVGALLLLTVTAGVAVAKSFFCDTVPCRGTNNNDQIGERQGRGLQDVIYGLGGNDTINAGNFGNDVDTLNGDGGSDFLNVQDGDTRDFARCGSGNRDVARIDATRRNADSFSFRCERIAFR
jgi:Ca2+-binding RTX toxin-like protein